LKEISGLLQGWEDSTQLGKDSAAIIGTSSATSSTATSSVTSAANLRGSLEDRLEREYLLSSQAASSSTSTPVPSLSSFTQAPINTYSSLSSSSLTDLLSNKYMTTTSSTTPASNITITTTSASVPVYKPTLWKASVSPPPTPPSPTKTPKYTFSSNLGKSSSIFENDNDLSKFEDPIKYNSWRASKLIEETQSLLNSQQVERAALAKVVVSSSPVCITTSTYTTVSSATKDSYLSSISVTSVKENVLSSTDKNATTVDVTAVQSPPNSSLPAEPLPILDHSPGEVYTIPEEEEEITSPIGSDGVTSLRRRGGQCQSSQDQLNLTPPDTPPNQTSSCFLSH